MENRMNSFYLFLILFALRKPEISVETQKTFKKCDCISKYVSRTKEKSFNKWEGLQIG